MGSDPAGLVSLHKGKIRYRAIFVDGKPHEDAVGRQD